MKYLKIMQDFHPSSIFIKVKNSVVRPNVKNKILKNKRIKIKKKHLLSLKPISLPLPLFQLIRSQSSK